MSQFERIYFAGLIPGLLCLSLMVGSPASAADKSPCSEDIAKFCKDVKSDFRSLMTCLEEHESELSDACKAHEAKIGGRGLERREEIAEKVRFHRACKDDVVRFCKDADPAGGGLIKCLKEHEKELSPPCGEGLKALGGDKKKTE